MACTTLQHWEAAFSIISTFSAEVVVVVGGGVTHLFVTDEILSADAGTVLLGIGHINK